MLNKKMKIRRTFYTLFGCGLFIFLAFFYRSHILFIEQLSFFHYTSAFWKQFAFQPGGWAVYCGNFLAQFYINSWAGALIQTLLALLLLIISENILKKTGVRSDWLLTGLIPALLLAALQLNRHFTPGDALIFITPFALVLIYMNISNVWARRLGYSLAIVPIYLFSGAIPTVCLFTACMIYELLYAKDKMRFSTPLWIMVVILLPFLWQSVYSTPNRDLFKIPYREYNLFPKMYNRLEEQKFAMSIAASQDKWDDVLKISARVKTPDNHTAFFTNLALSMKGELPQMMFHFQQTNENGLFLLRIDEWEEFHLRYGSEFFYRIGILNEAIRWIFDANILRAQGADYHTLTRLAVWNKENGYDRVAAKYFDILEGTMMYRKWAKDKRKQPNPKNIKFNENVKEFYVGGRILISELVQHYENNPQNTMIPDYLLCYMLLQNDIDKFLALFNILYNNTSTRIPQAYQEALLSAANMSKIDPRKYPIDRENEIRFREFIEYSSNGNKHILKERFGDTWWYYSYLFL